jgi:hypothetical protein
MDDKKQHLYTLHWTQEYEMSILQEALEDFALEISDFAEAKEVIARIKSQL